MVMRRTDRPQAGWFVLEHAARGRPPPSIFQSCGNQKTMRGQPKNISLPRRLIIDLMRASMGVPFVSLSRSLNIRPLLEARAGAMAPAGWAAMFVKAFALVAKDEPVLRTVYAKWPWPSLYEFPNSVASVAIVVIILAAIFAFYLVFGRGVSAKRSIDIDINVPHKLDQPADK